MDFFEIKKILDLEIQKNASHPGRKIESFFHVSQGMAFSEGVERIPDTPGPGAASGAASSEIKILRSRFLIFLISILQRRVGGRYQKSNL